MVLSLHRIRTIGLVIISPIALFLLAILVQDFVELLLQLMSGEYAPDFGFTLGTYLILLPVVVGYLGIRAVLRMLSHSV